jgi:hypothetical protein
VEVRLAPRNVLRDAGREGFVSIANERLAIKPRLPRQEQAISIVALTILSGRGSCADQFRRFLGGRGAR